VSHKLNFWSKIEFFIENSNFDRKSQSWSKIKILNENRNFDRKSKFWPKIEILIQNRNFDRKWKFWSKIETLKNNGWVIRCFSPIFNRTARLAIELLGKKSGPSVFSSQIRQLGVKNQIVYTKSDRRIMTG